MERTRIVLHRSKHRRLRVLVVVVATDIDDCDKCCWTVVFTRSPVHSRPRVRCSGGNLVTQVWSSVFLAQLLRFLYIMTVTVYGKTREPH